MQFGQIEWNRTNSVEHGRVAEYLAHYDEERPHQSLDNEPLKKPKKRGRPKTERGRFKDEIVPLCEVRCRQRFGGLLKAYSRKAA